jgi:hypothetical protein
MSRKRDELYSLANIGNNSETKKKLAGNFLISYEIEHLLVGLGFLVEGQGIGPGG